MFILLPFLAMRCVVLFFDEGLLLGLLTSNSCFLLTFLYFTCFPPSQNPLRKPLPLRAWRSMPPGWESLTQGSPWLFPRGGMEGGPGASSWALKEACSPPTPGSRLLLPALGNFHTNDYFKIK